MEELNPFTLVSLSCLVALVPIGIALLTSYVKISVVFGVMRTALGTSQVPSGLVIMALSLALTIHTMKGVIEETKEKTGGVKWKEMLSGSLGETFNTITPLLDPWKKFLVTHAGQREILALSTIENTEEDKAPTLNPVITAQPLTILIPAFILTELKEGFAMGFLLLLPFLVIDLVVANILVGMGMYMVSPVLVSLPLKLLLFVMADGWMLLAKALVKSYDVL